ncbi:hypothetical protein T09_14305 [Trichinella sp. T9]|nr:hypothetical protein T09_14305 [Trichinella sp. T9]
MIRSAVRQTVAMRNQGAQLQDATFRCVKREILLKQNSQLHISSISNLRKPVFNATCAVSVFYANWGFEN